MKKKLAVGAAIGAAVAFVLGPLRKRRQRRDADPIWYGPTDPAGAGAPGAGGGGGDVATTGTGGGAPVAVGADILQKQDPANVDPDDLTSPGTVDDPKLEEQRAREAAERERESRASDETKFDELRQEQVESDATEIVGDVPAPRED